MSALTLWHVAVLASVSPPIPAPKGIVIMFGDDVGYGDLSCFGHPTSLTPGLDRMAAEGMQLKAQGIAGARTVWLASNTPGHCAALSSHGCRDQ